MVTGNSGTVTASGSMVILASTTGNVGIGTASPALGFDVNVAAVFRQAVTVAGTVTVNSLISNIYGVFGQNVTVNSTNASISTTTGALVVAGGVGIGGNVYASGNVVAASLQPTSASVPGAGLFLPATNTIAVSTASTERMRIDTNGNVIIKGAVGVGTSTAAGMSTTGVSSNLYVWGNLIVANTALTSSGIYFPNGSYLTTGTYGPTNTIQVAGSGNALLGDSGSFVWDLANRRLGIGTSTPSYQLSVYGTDYVLFNTRPGGATRQEITVGNVASFGAVLGYDPSLAQSIGYLRRGDSAATTPAIAWNYVSSNYRVGINGITIPQNALDVNGALAVGNNYAGVVTGPNNGMIVQGTVGIGTGTPTTNANNQLTLFNATAAGIELATGGATPGGGNIIGITGGGLTVSTFAGGVGTETYAERMRIDANGNMGIGTPSPTARLSLNVSGAGSVTALNLTNDNGGFAAGTGPAINFSVATAATLYGKIEVLNQTATIGSNSYMAFSTRGGDVLAERMRINSSGQVGINTTNPGGILQVNTSTQGVDGIIIIGPNTSNQNGNMTIRPNNGQGNNNGITQAGDSGIIYSSNAGIGTGNLVIAPWFSGVSGIRMNGSGNVGIATTNATAALHVYSSSSTANLTQWNGGTSDANFITIAKSGTTGATLGTPQFSLGMDYSTTYVDLNAIKFARDGGAGGNMQFFTGVNANGTERMRINSSGFVGIGTNIVTSNAIVEAQNLTAGGGSSVMWAKNYIGPLTNPTEGADWPWPVISTAAYGNFYLQTMMNFTLPGDGPYQTGDNAWSIRLNGVTGSGWDNNANTTPITSSTQYTGLQILGPGNMRIGSVNAQNVFIRTNNVDRVAVTGNGNIMVNLGTTVVPAGTSATMVVNGLGTNPGGIELVNQNNGGGNIQALSTGGLQFGTFTGAVGAEVYNSLMTLTKPGTNATGNLAVTGNITATLEVTAYFSDLRLKDNIAIITNAVDKVMAINGVYYNPNQLAESLVGESITTQKVGLIAQEVQQIMPQVIRSAPFDIGADGASISGKDYMTIQYDKLVPLLVQAIKEQQAQIECLEARITTLELDP